MSGERELVYLVPHTHWDREWYLPFQRFRLKLVELVDRVLDLLEADERFVFTLDGQLATVDDYVEVRPEGEERIRRLVEAGRLAIGPWQTLMDEFLVSGETIVRDLEVGLARAAELGGAMQVGYLPDMFGHVAQMPQILRGAGIEGAVVWRGVPAAITRHAFTWEAPDGSSVRCEYLPGGYSNGAYLLDVPGRLNDRISELIGAMRPFYDGSPVLAMYGTDHAEPLPELVGAVDEANRAQQSHQLELATLESYLKAVDGPAERWRGELRSSARANLLMGVASARIDLKQAAARTEHMLERYAEPLSALYGGDWPERLLELAWRRVLENSAHDSICGCSVDEVSAQVLVRYAEARQIARGLAESAVERVAAVVPRGAIAIVNPLTTLASDAIELDLVVPEDWEEVAFETASGERAETQELGRTVPHLHALEMHGSEIKELFRRRLHGRELFGRKWNGFHVDPDQRRLTLELDSEADPPWLDVAELRGEIEVAVSAAPDETWTVVLRTRPRRQLLTCVPAPALGWTSARLVPGRGRVDGPVRVEKRTLDNGLLRIEVADEGTLRFGDFAGIGRLVDGGDAGDSYNYGPPARDRLVDRPEHVTVHVDAGGPIVGRLEVLRTYAWPEGLAANGSERSDDDVLTDIRTTVELRAGEPFLRLRISFDNRSRDHRLRFHVPLGNFASSSFADGQFAVVERDVTVEGGYGELALPTFPAHSFVSAGNMAVLLQHVLEYELVDGRELALTLLRSTGLISRNLHPAREDPAGPEIETPAAQLVGPWKVSFALYPHEGGWAEAGVPAVAERYRLPFYTAVGTGTGVELTEGTGLSVEGAQLTALRRRGGWLELRLVRLDPQPGTAVVTGDFSEARAANLLGQPGARLQPQPGRLELELSAWKIQTIQLR